jgi:hypothetical protein
MDRTHVKLGRHPRKFNPRVPHVSALLSQKAVFLPPIPAAVDYTVGMPASLGMFLNDQLGDCTIAGGYHAIQVWTFNSNPPMDTEPDQNVEIVYCQADGYVPGDPSTDNGGNEQDVLTYWMNQGFPILPSLGSTGTAANKLTAFLEIDVRNTDNIKRMIADCGVVYIGFNVPKALMDNITPVWDLFQDDGGIEGGHCVILAGYDSTTVTLVSWGQVYKMTWAFFSKYVDEAYALVDSDWITAKGTAPCGLTLDQLKQQMQALRTT